MWPVWRHHLFKFENWRHHRICHPQNRPNVNFHQYILFSSIVNRMGHFWGTTGSRVWSVWRHHVFKFENGRHHRICHRRNSPNVHFHRHNSFSCRVINWSAVLGQIQMPGQSDVTMGYFNKRSTSFRWCHGNISILGISTCLIHFFLFYTGLKILRVSGSRGLDDVIQGSNLKTKDTNQFLNYHWITL